MRHLEYSRFILPTIGAALSCVYLVDLARVANWETRFYPAAVITLLLITSVAVALSELRNARNRAPGDAAIPAQEVKVPGSAELRAAASLIVALGVLIAGLNFLGTIASSLAFIVVFRTLLKCLTLTALAVETAIVFFLVVAFQRLLFIPLPRGPLDDLILSLLG